MVLAMMSGAGDVAASPMIVPVAACAMVLGIVVVSIWAGVRSQEMRSQERLAAIARGVPVPPTAEELAIMHGKPTADGRRRRANVRLGGIVLLGTAAGLILFFLALAAVLRERDVLCGAAVGLIPLGVGVGLLIDAGMQKRELPEAAGEAHYAGTSTGPRSFE